MSLTADSSSRMNVSFMMLVPPSLASLKFLTPGIAVNGAVFFKGSTSKRNVVSFRRRRFRAAGVSHARIAPWSMIARRSHISSASAM